MKARKEKKLQSEKEKNLFNSSIRRNNGHVFFTHYAQESHVSGRAEAKKHKNDNKRRKIGDN